MVDFERSNLSVSTNCKDLSSGGDEEPESAQLVETRSVPVENEAPFVIAAIVAVGGRLAGVFLMTSHVYVKSGTNSTYTSFYQAVRGSEHVRGK